METLIIDASVAIKWLVQEDGTEAAVDLRSRFRSAAPDLLVAECANIIWKKVQLHELARNEAIMAGLLLQHSDIELVPMRNLTEAAITLAVDLGHPAYDCVYLALASHRQTPFVTADKRLLRVVAERAPENLRRLCVSLDRLRSVG